MTQEQALSLLKTGRSAFITGAAGSGKTYLLNTYIAYLKAHGAFVGITASTGIAATHMGGVTIHSWSGIGVRDVLSQDDIAMLTDRSYLRSRLSRADVLIIDEISMMHHFRLDLVDRMMRSCRKSEAPFGGVQVILCGDFFQLPPVSRQGEAQAKFAYHSDAWRSLNPAICYLEEQHRQSDTAYLSVLNAIRNDTVDEDIVERLQERFNKKPDVAIEPTRLYSHNADVDAENNRELGKLPGTVFEYGMESVGREPLVAVLQKGCLAPVILHLKAGARVMFVKNNFEMGYANGTLGVVTALDEGSITVTTAGGKAVAVEPASWHIEEEGKVKAEIMQYPLRLAWAITVHKSQGMSLDAAVVDLSRSFEKGMGYVALSRVRTLSGLSLLGLNGTALRVDEEVLSFDERFRVESEKHTDELRALPKKELASLHEAFALRISGASPKKAKVKKISTLEETKKLLSLGKSVAEIAALRGITTGTVLEHLEKLLVREPAIDLSAVRAGVVVKMFDTIYAALLSCATGDGTHPLTPVKEKLGSRVSYDEIRLVRLFLPQESGQADGHVASPA